MCPTNLAERCSHSATEPTGDAAPTAPWSLSSVSGDELGAVWPQIAPDLARVLDQGMGHTLDLGDLFASIERGDRLLWVVHDGPEIIASLILELVRYPSGRVSLRIVTVSGSRFWEWAEGVHELLHDYAQLVGAEKLEAVVRRGFTRWLDRLGWKPGASLMQCDVRGRHG